MPAPIARPGSEAGFSLVEMLTALAVLGLVASIVLLSGAPLRPSLASEADRLALRLAEARDLALVRNRSVLVEVTAEGYALRQRSGATWAPPAPRDATGWSEGVTVSAGAGRLPLSILFDPMGLSAPAEVILLRDGGRERVVLNGVGDVERE